MARADLIEAVDVTIEYDVVRSVSVFALSAKMQK
jgi:hypothetical protein